MARLFLTTCFFLFSASLASSTDLQEGDQSAGGCAASSRARAQSLDAVSLIQATQSVRRAEGQRASSAQGLEGGARRDEARDMEVQRHSLTVAAPAVEQRMVICNAYASPKALDVTRVSTKQSVLTGLAYKQCKEISVPLDEGEQFDFMAGSLNVGTFYATGVPHSSAALLLIPHRRSPHAVGVSFESHAFSDVKAPQIAVIDAYRGGSGQDGVVKLGKAPEEGKAGARRIEESLNFNSVVTLNPGKYDVSLASTGQNATALNVVGTTKYVVMRLGVNNTEYPQELLVFPNGAARAVTCWTLASLLMAVGAIGRIGVL